MAIDAINANNRTKRNIFLVILIAAVIGLFAILISKMCGINVDMFVWGADVGVLLASALYYSNFRKAVKEDEKYGKL